MERAMESVNQESSPTGTLFGDKTYQNSNIFMHEMILGSIDRTLLTWNQKWECIKTFARETWEWLDASQTVTALFLSYVYIPNLYTLTSLGIFSILFSRHKLSSNKENL